MLHLLIIDDDALRRLERWASDRSAGGWQGLCRQIRAGVVDDEQLEQILARALGREPNPARPCQF